jgi:hypothetical protein
MNAPLRGRRGEGAKGAVPGGRLSPMRSWFAGAGPETDELAQLTGVGRVPGAGQDAGVPPAHRYRRSFASVSCGAGKLSAMLPSLNTEI